MKNVKSISTLFQWKVRKGNWKLRKGFTVIELVLYMGLLMIFIGILLRLFSTSLDIQLESQSVSAVEQDGRYILSRLGYDIPSATSISLPASLGSSGTTLQLTANSSTYIYTVTNGDLTLQNDLGTNMVNSIDTIVSNFSVTRLGNSLNSKNAIRVAFTLTSRTQEVSGPRTKTFQTTIGMR